MTKQFFFKEVILSVVRSGPIFREALAPSFKSSFLVMKTGSLSNYGKLTSFTVAQVPFYGTWRQKQQTSRQMRFKYQVTKNLAAIQVPFQVP